MLKNKKQNYLVQLKYVKNFVVLLCGIVTINIISYMSSYFISYTFFIEFNDANGIKVGTPIRFRGIHVGSIQKIKLKYDCVLVLAKINSMKITIPKKSIIETTQTGLLNEAIIDIVPLGNFNNVNNLKNGPLSNLCNSSNFICNNNYLIGDRGLNYDDLIRSTTRISQRFDDPRFFNLFYIFLQNGIEITDTLLELLINIVEAFISKNIDYKNF